MANACMYFTERPTAKWANRTCSIYYRYIDDLFIMSNVHAAILKVLVRFWNRLDENIEFSETIRLTAEYSDIRFENNGVRLMFKVSHKPPHELYFLPFTSVHNEHIKRNIHFGAWIRAVRYSASYSAFKREEDHLCTVLLLEQLERVPRTFQGAMPTWKNYSGIRKLFLGVANKDGRKARIDFEVSIPCHFSLYKGMYEFSTRFHKV